MNEKKRKNMIDVLVIRVLLFGSSGSISWRRPKRISISHLLEGNWNSRFLVV